MRKFPALINLATAAIALLAIAIPALAADNIRFNRDIHPILSDNCFACHGPDKNKRKADLRLDVKEGLFRDREGTRPVVAGKLADSELFRRITATDSEDLMPPAKSGKSLTPAQIALLKRWIEQGADYEGHWSYIAPQRQAPPQVDLRNFVRNDVDRFILAPLQAAGLNPSAPADRATLCRRVYFDLTGLPPTQQQLATFEADSRPDAFEQLVGQLLASPHFGERMAVYWLDLVRFADSIGYHSDNPRDIYPFRNYVIKSFNANKRFDEFTIEQVAGDLLPDATLEQKVASAYNRLLQTTEEGGAQPKEYAAKYLSDRVRNLSTVWMAGTMMCCECHDHKFDPYTMKDFYSLEAFFADVKETPVGRRESGMPVPDEKQAAEIKRHDDAIAAARSHLNAGTPELAAAQQQWEESLRTRGVPQWTTLQPIDAVSAYGAKLAIEKDGSVLVSGHSPNNDIYTITARAPLKAVTAFRIEALAHPSLPAGGPGRAGNGNFVLTEFIVHHRANPTGAAEQIALQNATATFEQTQFAEENPYKLWSAASAIDNDVKGTFFGWAILPEVKKDHHAVFETKADIGDGREATFTFTIRQEHGDKHNIGRFRLSATSSPRPIRAGDGDVSKEVLQIVALEPEKRSDAQKQTLAAAFRTTTPLLKDLREEVAKLEKQKTDYVNALPKVLVTLTEPPRTVRMLPRGNWMSDAGDVVEPAVPHFLPQVPVQGHRLTRLDLAHWLVAKDNPLTARVFMNRLWKMYFGTGLSKTLEDLGSQGEWPTHPELLDALAAEFMASGWDVKHMVRLLVTSGTYRQSSIGRADLRERDPFNRLYARQSTFRLDAEFIRDNALAISGLLVDKLGGPSVKPYQPAGYWDYLNFPVRQWQNDHGESLYRRTLYTWWQRSFLQPTLLAFDAPSREEATCERARSNTPQQALTVLDDPIFVEAARVFAERIIREAGSIAPEQRIAFAFQLATDRKPSAAEAAILLDVFTKHRQQYAADPAAAKKLMAIGEKPAARELDPVDVAAWTSVTRTILNLHETMTRD
jgi:hypothetical protein